MDWVWQALGGIDTLGSGDFRRLEKDVKKEMTRVLLLAREKADNRCLPPTMANSVSFAYPTLDAAGAADAEKECP